MEKNHKSHKNSSNNTISLGELKKHKKHKKNKCHSSSSSSSDDDGCNECSKKPCCCKKKCKKYVGPPGPLVVTVMATGEPNGLDPGDEGIYCIIADCNTKYLSVGCYITIVCSSTNTAYFLITNIDDTGTTINIQNVNDETATWEVGAKVALVGPRGEIGATGATLFDIAPVADVSWPYGATLITGDTGLISLQLAPADNANPGLLTTTDQLVAGTKYFQDVIVAANFDNGPNSTWGGYNPGSMYFDTALNTLQLYLGSTVDGTFIGTTWATISTCGCTGGGGGSFNGVTDLGSTGLAYGATLTGDSYLQFSYAIGGGTTNTPGLMPGSYSDIFSTQGVDLTTNFGCNWVQTTNYAKYWNSISMSSSGQYQTACENDSSGSLFGSSDFGNNWTQLASTGGFAWKFVSISSSGQYQSAIYYDPDGGYYFIQISSQYGGNATWSYTGLGTSENLNCISLSASGQYQTACADNSGSIWLSSNYGVDWTQAYDMDGLNWKCVAVSSSGQYQTACMNDGITNYIYTSSNYGKGWVLNSYNPENGYITSVSLSSSGQYQSICTSLGGRVYISEDYGNTWSASADSPTNANLVSIAVSASGQYQVVAQQSNGSYTGGVFTSSDYGNNWSSNNNAPNDLNLAPWSGVAISASGQYIAGVLSGLYIWNCQNSISNGVVSVGNYSTTSGVTGVAGSIYYDTDDTVLKFSDGANWITVGSGSGSGFNGVTALGATGLSCGATLTGDSYLQFAYAIGGGTTNTPGLMPGSYSDIFATQGVDLANFGNNIIENATTIQPGGIAMSSSGKYQTCINTDAYAPGYLYISSDYGQTWSSFSDVEIDGTAQSTPRGWRDVKISSTGQYQIACVSGEYIYISSDYGNSWFSTNTNINGSSQPTGISWSAVSISSSGQYQCVVGAEGNGGYISNNFGSDFSSISVLSGLDIRSVSMSASGQYQILCVNYGYLWVSKDYGNTWSNSIYIDGDAQVSSSDPFGVKNWRSVSVSACGQYQTATSSIDNGLPGDGYIYISSDYGNTWSSTVYVDGSLQNDTYGWWQNSLSISASGQYQIAGKYDFNFNIGNVYVSTDYGGHWTKIPTWNGTLRVPAVSISSSGQYITICGYNSVLNSYKLYNCQNSISNGVVSVGNYRTTSGVTGVAGSIYYDTDDTVLKFSDGSVWTSVKSFVIDHPKDQEKLLVHGCLEGPEAGVYYRGKGVITNNESVVIELPDYVDKLATNLTVQLTPIYDGDIYKPQYFATEVSANKFMVHGVNGAFYWTVYGQRLSFIVEPNKNEVEIKGEGPYKWL